MSSKQLQEADHPPLFRYALCIEYDGSQYQGWQRQSHTDQTIQSKVEIALSKIANEPISVICSGRTDTGVHSCYQIIHFDTSAVRDERAWVLGTNTNLPYDIAVKWAVQVSDQFHARFGALERRYRYLIHNADVKPALLNQQMTWTYKPLDEAKMQQAGNYLVGTHDFTSYRAVACQAKSPVRELKALNVRRFGDIVMIEVRANAFLHHMIRNIAGVLMKIGAGEASPEWAKDVLEARDRRLGGVTALPHGLYFVDVKYPEEFQLPASRLGPAFLPPID